MVNLNADKLLYKAALEGDIEGVRQTLCDGGYVNMQDEFGFTPLMVASMKGHIKIMKELIYNKANVDLKSNSGRTALMDAVLYEEAVDLLIRSGACVDLKNNYGETALSFAVGASESIVKRLIRADADVNTQCNNECTPLVYATDIGRLDIVKVLLRYGANPNLPTIDGDAAIDIAHSKGFLDIETLLKDAMMHPEKYNKISLKDEERLQEKALEMNAQEILKLSQENEKMLKKLFIVGEIFQFVFNKLSYEEQKIFYGQTYKIASKETRAFMEQQLRDRVG